MRPSVLTHLACTFPAVFGKAAATSQLARTFVADNQSYGIYVAGYAASGTPVIDSMVQTCGHIANISTAAAPDVPDKWLANDNYGVGYQLWSNVVTHAPMQACLEETMQHMAQQEAKRQRAYDYNSAGFTFGVIVGVLLSAGATAMCVDSGARFGSLSSEQFWLGRRTQA